MDIEDISGNLFTKHGKEFRKLIPLNKHPRLTTGSVYAYKARKLLKGKWYRIRRQYFMVEGSDE